MVYISTCTYIFTYKLDTYKCRFFVPSNQHWITYLCTKLCTYIGCRLISSEGRKGWSRDWCIENGSNRHSTMFNNVVVIVWCKYMCRYVYGYEFPRLFSWLLLILVSWSILRKSLSNSTHFSQFKYLKYCQYLNCQGYISICTETTTTWSRTVMKTTTWKNKKQKTNKHNIKLMIPWSTKWFSWYFISWITLWVT